jgi:hypothetical protein
MGLTRPAEVLAEEPAATPPPAPPKPSRWWVDAALVAVLLPLAVVARRPGYLFSHPFWLDEGWVADSLRAPLSQVRLLTSRPRSAGPSCSALSRRSGRPNGSVPCRWRSGC